MFLPPVRDKGLIEQLAKRIRLYELARELGLTNKEALDLAEALGIGVRSHSSSIEDAQADRVRRKAEREGLIRPVQAAPEPAAPAPPAASAPAAPSEPRPAAVAPLAPEPVAAAAESRPEAPAPVRPAPPPRSGEQHLVRSRP